jgi:hypothetical protein
MQSDTAAQTAVCIDGMTFYVLNAYHSASESSTFQALPGGTHDALDGNRFWGLRLDDIVNSSYMGYQLYGYSNGYHVEITSDKSDKCAALN